MISPAYSLSSIGLKAIGWLPFYFIVDYSAKLIKANKVCWDMKLALLRKSHRGFSQLHRSDHRLIPN